MNIKYIEGDEDIPSGYYIKDGNIFYSLEDLINQKDKEIERLNNIINETIEDIKFCLMSINQEYRLSTDERTRTEMETCKQILENRLKELKETK